MANLFGLLFIIYIIVTIILLIKPSLTALKNKPPLPRLKILVYGFLATLFSMVMIGLTAPKVDPKKLDVEQFSDDQVKVSQDKDGKIVVAPVEQKEKTQADKDKDAAQIRQQFEDRKAELDEEDKPHFGWPRVDYTKTVAKVDLSHDQAILKAVGKPVVEKEQSGDQNDEPSTIYYFSKDLSNGLDITLSRTSIHVNWQFDAKDSAKATAAFEDGQRITRALLGGKVGSDVYENMAKGLKFSEIVTIDGITLKNVRCGASVCRYEVLR
ncbi:hypothetical protein [Acinetobacter sp.]|uniref:hypothetical protein n=1 Tax=Acinetobacter sp. TaxID=472 RepID=UPI00257AA529|nr:hypothetical protein [Acinetobacter sp.]